MTVFASRTPPAADAPLVIFLSGDGLATRFETRLANLLASRGVETVLFRSLHFFWNEKTPREVADAIEDVAARHRRDDNQRPIILVGYSFGGAIAPFAFSEMSANLRRALRAMVLLAPASKADFEFNFISWFNISSPGARDVSAKLDELCSAGLRILTVHGARDAARARPKDTASCNTLTLPGGHDFGRDFTALAELIEHAGIVE
ncbi:MAG: alpha/beta fold hydrolase [Parvularculaceae bacterium]|nr:alpha/beta fold hydrolase [Parvularculaceae bacterium]